MVGVALRLVRAVPKGKVMPRMRYLKPDFFDDEDLCTLRPLARLLFAGLWCWADREGRLEDSPARLKKNILGYDNCRIEGLLADLADSGHILRYSAPDGRSYIQVVNFLKHQRPHIKEVPSTIPAPDGIGAQHLPESVSDPPGMGNGEQEQEWGMGNGEPPPSAGTFRLFVRTFGKYPPRTLEPALHWAETRHPPECLTWAFETTAGLAKPNWNYTTAILNACDNEGHGPRERRNGYAATKQSTDDVRFPASEGWSS
jgi:hypothetical protein